MATHPGIENRRYLNVIAQEFQQVFPEWVKPSGEKLPTGEEILQVDTYPVTIYTAAAVQELAAKVRELAEQNQGLQQANAELSTRLERLEQAMGAQH